MQKYNFKNKKVGVWGAGIVGQSAINFFLQNASKIQLLTDKYIEKINPQVQQILQNPKSIKQFWRDNDYILSSPGIPLHNYTHFSNKIITEADVLQQEYKNPIFAITGTAGKTTVTHILQRIFDRYRPTIAAGNIGYPMLDLLTKKHEEKLAVIELSSFQLQHTKKFAPDLAIITNFFGNHLDYHKSEDEYYQAKTNIFAQQNQSQKTLLPPSFIKNKSIKKGNLYTFSKDAIQKEGAQHFYIERNKIIFASRLKKIEICDTTKLPTYTFPENWLIIIATLHLNNITVDDKLYDFLHQLSLPEHRLAPICTINGSIFYNDSKSTTWQSTVKAIDQIKKPISLFLGGLSKGVDRAPLIDKISKTKNIIVFAFGKESEQIKKMCKAKNITTYSAPTLEKSFQQCMKNINTSRSILFSPGGSSFDLFKNYKERGKAFKKLTLNLLRNK